MRSEFGDFQTPLKLVESVVKVVSSGGRKWKRVVEPTCGCGNFIQGVLQANIGVEEIKGLDIQENYVKQASSLCMNNSVDVEILQGDVFKDDLLSELKWKTTGEILIIGNPPWVTNSELGSLGSTNLPHKENIRKLKGLEALTGGSNFDIAEAIVMKLIRDFGREDPTIALLIKTVVVRNILQYASDSSIALENARMYRIDAKKWFNAAVDACLFCVDVGAKVPNYQVEVYDCLESDEPATVVGVSGEKLIADMKSYRKSEFVDGKCQFTWRQGLKHDLSKVMELKGSAGNLMNQFGEPVDVEEEYVYPLLKSSDLARNEDIKPRLSVIVTQKKIGEDTRYLEVAAPKLWKYMGQHRELFYKRKSSIYKGKPAYSIFGIGEYSFSLYKVGISGLYKKPVFRVIYPIEGRPVMLDDTCYFIPCESAEQAVLISVILNDKICLDFLNSTVFWDSKRPVTKKLLQRIDIRSLLENIDRSSLLARAREELYVSCPSKEIPTINASLNIVEVVFGETKQGQLPLFNG